MKDKRITIVNPLFPKLLRKLEGMTIPGVCANIHCGHQFEFSGAFIIERMLPHIDRCKEREEKRGSHPWIEHWCDECGKKFVWDVPMYTREVGEQTQFRFELKTMKFLGPIKWNK